MTKKHFIALADVMRDCKPTTNSEDTIGIFVVPGGGSEYLWQKTVEKVADFCQSQNSRFNRERWLAYIAGKCGPNGGKL